MSKTAVKYCLLHILGRYVTAKVWINSSFVSEMLFDRKIDVSGYAVKGANLLDVEFTAGNHNAEMRGE